MNELALFAGAGGGILGGKLLGWRTVCAVEIEEYCRRILMQRQDDGILDPFPIWDDVRTFDGNPWRGVVDLVSGGFPCQDICRCGSGKGIEGERSGLWSEMARIVNEVHPRHVFIENAPQLVKRGLAVVLCDLAEMGYDARWGIVGAHHVAGPHKRDRIWIVASADTGHPQSPERQDKTDTSAGTEGGNAARNESAPLCWWTSEPRLERVGDGVADLLDRTKAIGNGQVPAVAALAWEILGENSWNLNIFVRFFFRFISTILCDFATKTHSAE